LSYEIDFEIVYTILNGHHQFNKVWEKVNGIGSKQTFSNHLTELVQEQVIVKRMVNGKPEYHINEIKIYETDKKIKKQIDKDIKLITQNHKKKSDKVVLKKFVIDTIKDLTFHSLYHFDTIMPSYQTDKRADIHKQKMLDKLIKTRIDILQKRDPKLLIVFNDLIKNKVLSDY